jgi:hypothetical protein
MNVFDAGHRLQAPAFEALLDDALDYLLQRLEVIEGRALPSTKSSLALLAANGRHHLAALQRVTTMRG